jgi:hypothetical protein
MLPKLDRFVPVRILGNSFEIAGSRDAEVDGVVEMLERPADVPGVRPGGIGQLRVGLVLLVVSPPGQIGEVVPALATLPPSNY